MATELIEGSYSRMTYNSLDEYADAAEKHVNREHLYAHGLHAGKKFTGHTDFEQALTLARSGWDEHLTGTIDLAESAVSMCERDHEELRPEMTFDVCGDSVDIGRYVTGEPECMVDYPLTPVSTSGKVITLCASTTHWAHASAESITRRGQAITALALALSRLGHAVEIWADYSSDGSTTHSRIRVLVKGANDTLDPSRILFAFAHPAMQRQIGFAVRHGQPEKFRRDQGVDSGTYGHVGKVEQNMTEGTIYVQPEDWTDDPATEVETQLRKLGLITS